MVRDGKYAGHVANNIKGFVSEISGTLKIVIS